MIGGGNAGELIVREMRKNELRVHADRHPRRRPGDAGAAAARGQGGRHDRRLDRVLREQRPDEVVIAMPSASGARRQTVVEACRAQGIPVRTLPSAEGAPRRPTRSSADARRAGRGPARPSARPARPGRDRLRYASGRSVLVTGAGGSIGSEIVPPGRETLPGARCCCSTTPRTTCFDDRPRAGRPRASIESSRVLADITDAPRIQQMFDAARARTSCSTPPRTSTCR